MIILALDLSTKNSGWACFNNGKLHSHGYVTHKIPGLHKMKYPEGALHKILDMSFQIRELVHFIVPDLIVIEEVNKGKNRISQKSLDALHFFVLEELRQHIDDMFNKIKYIDSDGRAGWRPTLAIKLDDHDKAHNKLVRKLYKGKKARLRKEVIGPKHLSCRYVNKLLGFNLDHVANESDGDIADAICCGIAYIKKTSK